MSRQVPQKFLAGDTIKFTVEASPYSSTDGYGLSLKISGPSGSPQKTEYTATSNTSSATKFDLRIGPSDSANLAAGLYSYAVVASDNTDSYTIESGTVTVEVRADLSSASDLRTHNQKVYEAICALLEGRVTSDVNSYTIAGRTLTKMSVSELLKLKDHYKDLVAADQSVAGAGPKKLFVRFPYNA